MNYKNYEVKIIAFAIVVVIGAESEEKALEYATEDCGLGELQLDTARIECEIAADKLEQAIKHADVVSEPDHDERP